MLHHPVKPGRLSHPCCFDVRLQVRSLTYVHKQKPFRLRRRYQADDELRDTMPTSGDVSMFEQLGMPGSRLRQELTTAVSTITTTLIAEDQPALIQVRSSPSYLPAACLRLAEPVPACTTLQRAV